MMTRTMLSSLAAVALALHASVAVAQEVPTLDVGPRQWAQFSPESRARCSGIEKSDAGAQSYVELLTCLQIAKDVKSLPKQ